MTSELTAQDIERRVRELGTWFQNMNLRGVQTSPQQRGATARSRLPLLGDRNLLAVGLSCHALRRAPLLARSYQLVDSESRLSRGHAAVCRIPDREPAGGRDLHLHHHGPKGAPVIEAVMLWNEPNNLSHWNFELDKGWSIFGEMTKLAADAVRAENPKLRRVLGGISPI